MTGIRYLGIQVLGILQNLYLIWGSKTFTGIDNHRNIWRWSTSSPEQFKKQLFCLPSMAKRSAGEEVGRRLLATHCFGGWAIFSVMSICPHFPKKHCFSFFLIFCMRIHVHKTYKMTKAFLGENSSYGILG